MGLVSPRTISVRRHDPGEHRLREGRASNAAMRHNGRGAQLSGGQKQWVAIVKDPRILLLDAESERVVQHARPIRLAYQLPVNRTFLSEQTSHQQPANSIFLSEQTIRHQPPAKRTCCWIAVVTGEGR
jgi:hypothetical protein